MDHLLIAFIQVTHATAQAASAGSSESRVVIFTYIGQLAAALTAVGVIYKFLVRPVILAVRKISSMYDKVEGLVAQFETNGGSSMRDSVNRIERTIVTQDSRQRILLGLVPFAIVETDAGGKLIFCNRVYMQWTGRTESEVLGDGWINVVHPNDRERVKHEWIEAVIEIRSYEARFKMLDLKGKSFDVFCRCYPMVDDSHEDIRSYGWFAVIYKCDSDVCIKDPDACPFSLASGTCRGGDHSKDGQLKPSHTVVVEKKS